MALSVRHCSVRVLVGWSLAIALSTLGAVGCDSKQEPKSPLQSEGRYELKSAQASILGEAIESLPDEGLVDGSGEPFSFEDVSGKPLVLSAIYTSCPMPEMCPLLTSKLGNVQKRMREEMGADPSSHRFVLFSIDPEKDTPKMMRNYVTERGWNLDNAVLVTGDPSTIDEVSKRLGIAAEREEDDTLSHNIRTYLVGSDGTFEHGFRTSEWEVDRLSERLYGLLQ